MKLLQKEQIKLELCQHGEHVILSLFENEGYRDWEIYKLSYFPNNLISFEDLKRFGINIDHL